MDVKTQKLQKLQKLKPVSENAIHNALASLFATVLPRHVMWWHTPSGEKRDAVTGAKLKRMGVVPGVPDFLLYDTRTGHLHAIEVKNAKGHLSDAQKGWKARFDGSPTGRYAVARSVDDARQIILEWWPDARIAI